MWHRQREREGESREQADCDQLNPPRVLQPDLTWPHLNTQRKKRLWKEARRNKGANFDGNQDTKMNGAMLEFELAMGHLFLMAVSIMVMVVLV